jgi:hypothetical protein
VAAQPGPAHTGGVWWGIGSRQQEEGWLGFGCRTLWPPERRVGARADGEELRGRYGCTRLSAGKRYCTGPTRSVNDSPISDRIAGPVRQITRARGRAREHPRQLGGVRMSASRRAIHSWTVRGNGVVGRRVVVGPIRCLLFFFCIFFLSFLNLGFQIWILILLWSLFLDQKYKFIFQYAQVHLFAYTYFIYIYIVLFFPSLFYLCQLARFRHSSILLSLLLFDAQHINSSMMHKLF